MGGLTSKPCPSGWVDEEGCSLKHIGGGVEVGDPGVGVPGVGVPTGVFPPISIISSSSACFLSATAAS